MYNYKVNFDQLFLGRTCENVRVPGRKIGKGLNSGEGVLADIIMSSSYLRLYEAN